MVLLVWPNPSRSKVTSTVCSEITRPQWDHVHRQSRQARAWGTLVQKGAEAAENGERALC